jgi:hypothetical protein
MTSQNEDGSWSVNNDETAAVRANHVISAFGSTLTDAGLLKPLELDEWGLPKTDSLTQVRVPGLCADVGVWVGIGVGVCVCVGGGFRVRLCVNFA